MRFIKVFLFVLTCIILPVSLSAQTVSGKLIDENSQPLPYANVVLLSLPDSAFVSGTISGEDGSFTLEATSENQIVKISSIGYKTVCKPVSPANIGIVQLVSDAQMLGEVVVKGNLPVTRMKGDAMVTSVENSVLSKVGSANDVLTKIPGITKNRTLLRSSVKERLLYMSTAENCMICQNLNSLTLMISRAWRLSAIPDRDMMRQ